MVVFLVLLTVILLITFDYFVRKRKLGNQQSGKLTLPLYKIFMSVPPGVFLQSSLTWSKILDCGNLAVGIHPFLIGLIDRPDEIRVMHSERTLNKGDILATIRKGEKILHIKSPVAGTILPFDKETIEYSNWENLGKNYLCIMKPDKITEQVRSWYIGEEAKSWTKGQYQQIKNFLMKLTHQSGLGLTMADGGDIPVGILQNFDEEVWQDFEKEFLK